MSTNYYISEKYSKNNRKLNFTKQEYIFEREGRTEQMTILIAKAWWIFHYECCNVDHGSRWGINKEAVIERTLRHMELIKIHMEI